jgi:hypothetical protein
MKNIDRAEGVVIIATLTVVFAVFFLGYASALSASGLEPFSCIFDEGEHLFTQPNAELACSIEWEDYCNRPSYLWATGNFAALEECLYLEM